MPIEETKTRDRHASFYAVFMQRMEAELIGRRQALALKEIETDIENVLTAWRWSLSQGQLREIERIMESLGEFYRIRGEQSDIADVFERAAQSLGWHGYKESEAFQDSSNEHHDTLRMLERAASILVGEVHKKDVVLGKMLSLLNRFY